MKKYNILNDKQKLEEFSQIVKDKELLSFDTETNGLNLYKTVIIGFSISYDSESGIYVPLLEWQPHDHKALKTRKVKGIEYRSFMDGHFIDVWTGEEYPEDVTPKEYTPPKFIKEYLSKWLVGKNLIMHNAPFDVNQVFANFGVDLASYVFVDTSLLSHVINENSPNGLKKVAEEWREELGINPHAMANKEQIELKTSVIENGGKTGNEVWRADSEFLGKYACADTFLTFGLYEVGMKKLLEEFGDKGLSWFLKDEVMPLCKEVVILMKRKGVYVDVPYFTKVYSDTVQKMNDLEDAIIIDLNGLLDDLPIAKTYDEAISKQRLVKEIITYCGLEIPKNRKGRDTLAKAEVLKKYQEEPHWIWGYILGEDELKLSNKELLKINAKVILRCRRNKA